MAFAGPQMLQDSPSAGGNRLLLIEHDPAVGQSLELLLAAAGFFVERTASGADGLSCARSGDYDLVVLGPNPPELKNGDLRSSLRLSRIDAPFRFLSVSVKAGCDGNTMQITPCP